MGLVTVELLIEELEAATGERAPMVSGTNAVSGLLAGAERLALRRTLADAVAARSLQAFVYVWAEARVT